MWYGTPAMTEEQPRERLLAAAVDHAVAHGIGELTLREIAAAIGTSHRMLIYHFGSKEGFLTAVVRAVEDTQRRLFGGLASDPDLDPADAARRFWAGLADPGLWPQERLFFELYARALQGRPGTDGFLDGIVESWVAAITDMGVERGIPREVARVDARLGVAVTRGLLLDLLATGDRPAVDEALERYLQLQEWRGSEG
jgi:AcrR family transcriptional regulator